MIYTLIGVLYIMIDNSLKKQTSSEIINLSANQSFFELLRKIEYYQNDAPRLGTSNDHSRERINIVQPADMSFASSEVIDIKQNLSQILIKIRHFGMFAPYGPLPIHITEHVRNELLLKRNEAFQKFVNIISQRFAILHYRAWSQLKAIIGHDHEDSKNPFLLHLQQISGVHKELPINCHIQKLRQSFPGVYFSNRRSLKNLNKILSVYFNIPIKITPRYAKWIDDGKKTDAQKMGFLGKSRIGSRFFDAQYGAHIQIGPLPSPVYQEYQRKSVKLLALMSICHDFVNYQLMFDVSLIIKTETGMAAQLGKKFLSKDGWLKPDIGMYKQLVYQSTT